MDYASAKVRELRHNATRAREFFDAVLAAGRPPLGMEEEGLTSLTSLTNLGLEEEETGTTAKAAAKAKAKSTAGEVTFDSEGARFGPSFVEDQTAFMPLPAILPSDLEDLEVPSEPLLLSDAAMPTGGGEGETAEKVGGEGKETMEGNASGDAGAFVGPTLPPSLPFGLGKRVTFLARYAEEMQQGLDQRLQLLLPSTCACAATKDATAATAAKDSYSEERPRRKGTHKSAARALLLKLHGVKQQPKQQQPPPQQQPPQRQQKVAQAKKSSGGADSGQPCPDICPLVWLVDHLRRLVDTVARLTDEPAATPPLAAPRTTSPLGPLATPPLAAAAPTTTTATPVGGTSASAALA